MKRLRSGPFFVGLTLIVLQVLSFAGIVKGGGSIFPQPSGPLGRIHPYDLGVFLVSALPGIIGVVLIVVSIGRSQKPVPPEAEHTRRGAPAWTVVLLSVALVAAVGIIFWQRYFLPLQFAENTLPLLAEKEKEGREAGYSEGYENGNVDGYSAGYDKGYIQGCALYSGEVWFFRHHAGIVTTTGSKYHHYGCPHIGDNGFYIYNIENAKGQGYTPCLDCWEQGLEDLPLPPLS